MLEEDGNKSSKKAKFEITDQMLEDDFEEVYKNYPLNEDTTCGFGFFRGSFLQMFANKKMYVILFGIAGSIFSATFAYFNGTITTIEKRFKISSTNSAIITTGNNVSSLIVSSFLAYYAGKGHRPRWIGFGLFTITMFCVFSVIPHFLYGPGEQALKLTKEYGGVENDTATLKILEGERRKFMCNSNGTTGIAECDEHEDYWIPQIFLFLGQLSIGIGQCVYNSIGVAYMDDNIKKSKTPALISASYFLRLLGPAGGYALASYCLQIYIVPNLTPTITNIDPRWLGAWWIGWIVLAVIMTIFAIILCMFPKELPRSYLRRRIDSEKRKRGLVNFESNELKDEDQKASLKDFWITFKRLLKNKTYMVNNVSSMFYFFGFEIYVIFLPKYIETQYKQSASTASFFTGSVGMVFSAIGILSAGLVITKYKPKARSLALWNVIVGFLAVFGILAYTQLGCVENENSVVLNTPLPDILDPTCNSNCNCDYVKYSPVCGADNKIYISPCHAGCKSYHKDNGTKFFTDCSCIDRTFGYDFENITLPKSVKEVPVETFTSAFERANDYIFGGTVKDKACPINCQKEFILFLAVTCFLKFSEATGRASNFLVGMRCIEERDKTLALGFSFAFFAVFSFLPSPVFYGALIDMACIVWGKTCTGTGNCWLYDTEWLRYWLNLIACAFVFLGVVFDCGVWYLVKDLKIFDGESEEAEMEEVKKLEN
ncbi:solute carrier organic anion transporter family member 74D-like [Chironomus tepperi]|uniref:solute carrier organic anion transporter family member 74D-like n=1 Tax=Chironomus tepperi TaxID=113505 RepID=UPI00391F8984